MNIYYMQFFWCDGDAITGWRGETKVAKTQFYVLHMT